VLIQIFSIPHSVLKLDLKLHSLLPLFLKMENDAKVPHFYEKYPQFKDKKQLLEIIDDPTFEKSNDDEQLLILHDFEEMRSKHNIDLIQKWILDYQHPNHELLGRIAFGLQSMRSYFIYIKCPKTNHLTWIFNTLDYDHIRGFIEALYYTYTLGGCTIPFLFRRDRKIVEEFCVIYGFNYVLRKYGIYNIYDKEKAKGKDLDTFTGHNKYKYRYSYSHVITSLDK
jgi:hypothetical protein